ncbi:ligand-binding sensor domain-containing diguanylate cyclase [Pseudorhodoferax sp. Leaf267]|uniref:ligand-binding sensor domain-containing diguanylate cyclase n=1 Tax=Pseudorhodoferax sp. Leaf267 TaxID=1736316 RepID=UPI00071321DF|nr:ligand-binding sensor domain-containing diguanylate cyclase [Pseudorhodoferax sp. Leaf267]KQP22132.1 hypothetical protein ASF43_25220 [Pseudorhodoferax sp. Leaf267]
MDLPNRLAVRSSGDSQRLRLSMPRGHHCTLWVATTLLWVTAPAGAGEATDPTAPHRALTPLRFESVGADAIPRDVVSAIAQDRHGFLWVGTGDGLVRYDGYRFRPLERSTPDATRRSLGWVAVMCATADGRLWLAPESGGVALYDPRTEQVVDVPAWQDGEARPGVLAMLEADDGGLWVGTEGQGLLHLDAQGLRQPLAGAEALDNAHVQALAPDGQGGLWIGTWAGLWRYTPGAGGLTRVVAAARLGDEAIDLDRRAVHALLRTGDGRLWIGTRQGELLRVDASGESPARLVARNDALPGGTGAIRSMVEVDGELWVARDTGIDRRDLAEGALKARLQHDPRRPGGLAGNEIFAMLRDQAGAVWVGGPGGGLQRHDPRQRGIWVRGADTAAGSALSDPDVRSLLRLADGRLWAATRRGGVAILDASLQVRGTVRWPPGEAAPLVDAMAQDAQGAVWVAGSTQLVALDPQGQVRERQALPSPVRALLAGRDGNLWIATRNGLYRRPPAARASGSPLLRVALAPEAAWTDANGEAASAPGSEAARVLGGDVYALAEDEDGTLWVGTAQGLYWRPPGDDRLRPMRSPPDEGLASQAVIGLLVDRGGRLWVDTAVAGLHRLLARDGPVARFDRISLRLGQAGRPFGANLMQDGQGRIWTHMHLYDPAADRMQALTPADGVRFGTGWFGAYAQLGGDRLLFGGTKGLLVIDARQVDAASHVPPLRLAELRVDGQRTAAWRPGQPLTLPPSVRSVTAEAAALHYGDPRRVHYTWRLQGYETAWVQGGEGQRTASYGHLPPGRYTLQMRAADRAGPWQSEELNLAVHVLPAWWQTWWSRLLAVGLAGSAIWALVQWRTRRLRADQARLEALVRARTREIEATARALEQSSLTDPLTGLRNRRYLSQHLEPEVKLVERRIADRQQRGQPPLEGDDLIFFVIDIDHFKEINDRHGHAAGDAVLVDVARRLRAVFRESDHLVRWGGEEFLVVARGTSRREAAALAERVRQEIGGTPFDLGTGATLRRTCSVGFAAFPLAMAVPRALAWMDTVALADRALYVAKHSGRNGWIGLVDSRARDAGALQAQAGRSIAAWADDGDLVVSASMPAEAWRAAASFAGTPYSF